MRRTPRSIGALGLLLAILGVPAALHAAPITASASGATAGDIQGTVDGFRFILGNNNGNDPGTLGGRREINWDGGGATTPSTGPTPFTVFQNNRGATMTSPGTAGFIQAAPGDLAIQFGQPTHMTTFAAFSPLRLFTPLDTNVTDVTFSIPGSGGAQPAFVSAFGAIFSDVDTNATTMEFFDPVDASLGSFTVPFIAGANQTFSFLAVAFDAGEQIARVRITTGGALLEAPDGELDVVVMDDFIYSEPALIPEPGTLTLIGFGLAGLGARRRPPGRQGTWTRSLPSKGGA